MGSTQRARIVRMVLAIICVALPIITLAVLLVRQSFNLPLMPDDYHAILNPITQLRTLPTFATKLRYWLTFQHNEYKLWLVIGIAYLQSLLTGRVNFRVLSFIGDAFLLPLAALLFALFANLQKGTKDLASILFWFAPVSFLLFELSYHESLNWPEACLQNFPVLVFSLLAIYLLCASTKGTFFLAAGSFVLATATSGNGLLLLPVGGLILLRNRRYGHLFAWVLLSLALVVAYSYGYNSFSSQVAQHRSIYTTMLHLNPTYIFAFLGSVMGTHGSILLGVVLTGLNVWALFTGFFNCNAALGYCVLFILLTAIGVAGIRSEFGIAQATSSRYRIYCVLLICFAWYFLAERAYTWRSGNRQRLLAGVLILSFAFALHEDRSGYQLLAARKQYAVQGMALYQRSLQTGTQQGPVAWETDQPTDLLLKNAASRDYLQRAVKVGTYRIP